MSNQNSNTTPKQFLEAAIQIAQEAGTILREEFALPPDIRYKGDVDFVTQADKRSEQAIVARLSKYLPTHTVASAPRTGHERGSHFRWSVAQLDGRTGLA